MNVNETREAPQAALLDLVRETRILAEDMLADGVRWCPVSLDAAGPARVEPHHQDLHASGRAIASVLPVGVARAAEGETAAAGSLPDLRTVIGDCRRCKLAAGRTQIVFGVGNPTAELMFVGEGPGYDEDIKGEPFVGRAGQLLTDIITRGMKLRREDVYIANIVKCRPPGNRAPEADEIEACFPFLKRQVELVRPRVIVALGSVAAQALTGLKIPISRLRGRWYELPGARIMPTFHPAYLLRNPASKRETWEDVKLVLAELGRSS